NKLHGNLPKLPNNIEYVDFSNNNFKSKNNELKEYLKNLFSYKYINLISFYNNKNIKGVIPFNYINNSDGKNILQAFLAHNCNIKKIKKPKYKLNIDTLTLFNNRITGYIYNKFMINSLNLNISNNNSLNKKYNNL